MMSRQFGRWKLVLTCNMAHHLFRARTIIVGKKGVTDAMNSLQRVMQNEKQIKDIQLNRYYEKPTVKRRRKKYESKLRIYKAEMDRKIGFLSKKDRGETPWSWITCGDILYTLYSGLRCCCWISRLVDFYINKKKLLELNKQNLQMKKLSIYIYTLHDKNCQS